jgi:anti-anti-sigma factor
MKVFTRLYSDHYLVSVTGSIEPEEVSAFDNQLQLALQIPPPFVVIDCQQLIFVCTPALRSFLRYQQQFHNNRKKLILFGLQPEVITTFSKTGLEAFFTIVATYEQALRYIDSY